MNAKYPKLEVTRILDDKPPVTMAKTLEIINGIMHEEICNCIQEELNKLNKMIEGKK